MYMPKEGKYSVVSQTSNEKAAEKIKSDNKNLDAGIAVGLKYLGRESQDTYELTTVFKCDPFRRKPSTGQDIGLTRRIRNANTSFSP